MSDSTKPPSIPSWQRQSGAAPVDESSHSPASSPSADDAPSSRSELVEQAARFLEDEAIRGSPTDRKISFLESKGLNTEEIDQLLGVSRNDEASSEPSATSEQSQQEHSISTSTPSEQPLPSTKPSPSTSTMPAPQSTPTAATTTTTTTTPSASRDVPPIITYPEFLVQPANPPPLVTMQRIIYTVYGAAGLAASIYGASEYLVKPMLATLTDARHDLFTTASENLKQLNEKLESSVSEIPAQLNASKPSATEDVDDDNDSVTSDPTELFHRDMGTQTSPSVTSTSLETALKESQDGESKADTPVRAVTGHMSRIEAIQKQLNEVNDVERESNTLDDSMRSSLTDLHHYLDGLIYAAPVYTAGSASYGVFASGTPNGSGLSTGVRKSEDEAIANFKAEIRGVKGALLSARNFPASRGGRMGGAAAAR